MITAIVFGIRFFSWFLRYMDDINKTLITIIPVMFIAVAVPAICLVSFWCTGWLKYIKIYHFARLKRTKPYTESIGSHSFQ